MIAQRFYFLLMLFFAVASADAVEGKPYILKTLYGTFTLQEPLLIELINHPKMQRLKHIRQYGLRYYTESPQEYSRYDHSVGVFALLRRYNTSLLEQAAGLYHDISHTVFSHLGDYIFDHHSFIDSYQDGIHLKFLKDIGMDQVLSFYNLTPADIIHKNGTFKALEQDLPEICADRLEYNISGGLLENYITPNDIELILNNLKYENEQWYFLDASAARKLADIPLKLTVLVWGSPAEAIRDKWGAQAIKRALELSVLSLDDIHFSTDDKVLETLISLNDAQIRVLLHKVFHCKDYFKVTDSENYDSFIKSKFRGIDPLVKTDKGFKRLTAIDFDFAQEFNRVKRFMEAGYYIKFIDNK